MELKKIRKESNIEIIIFKEDNIFVHSKYKKVILYPYTGSFNNLLSF